MSTKPVDRLLFAQGGLCFFCQKELPRADATVEHLIAVSKGGNNHDDNCVACCKSLNALFRDMTVKQKLDIVLKQKGSFKCPNSATKSSSIQPAIPAQPTATNAVELVVRNLMQRGNSKPRQIKTLESTIKALIKGNDEEARKIIEALCKKGVVTIDGSKVSYTL